MRIYKARNCNYLYTKILKDLLKEGKEITVRGLKTIEFDSPVITIIKKPQERLLSCYGRKINPFFLCAEILWILSGRGDREWITRYCKNIDKYSDEGYKDFNGAYGVRIRKYGQMKDGKSNLFFNSRTFDQIKDVIEKLKKDKNTRQAIMTLHNPIFDRFNIKTNDRPCNVISMFKIRNNKLNLHQIIRSNDLNLGLFPTNVFQWSMIQEYVASSLAIGVGELLFFSDSLHIYIDDKITKSVIKNRYFDIYKYIDENNYMPFCSLEEKDKIVNNIINNSRRLIGLDNFWYSFCMMLEIYKLRKKGEIKYAIEITDFIENMDLKIMAFNYHWNKAKNSKEKILIKSFIEDFKEPIKDFIMEKN